MRFLLYFPLLLLLILGSFVSIDAASQSVFKPVSPWPPQKPRLKRSTDDPPAAAADALDSLSFDELEQRYAKDEQALKESNATVAAAKAAWQQKETDAAGLREQYETKKTEWEAMDASANKEKNERDRAKSEYEAVTKAIQTYTTASKLLAKVKRDLEKAQQKRQKITDAPTRKPEAERELDAMDSSRTCETLQDAIEPKKESAESAQEEYNDKERLVGVQQKAVEKCTVDCEDAKNTLADVEQKRDIALQAFNGANATYTKAIDDFEKCEALKKEVEELEGFVDNNDKKIGDITKRIEELVNKERNQQTAVDDSKPNYEAAEAVREEKERAFAAAKTAFEQNPKDNERIAAGKAHTELNNLEETRNKATTEAEQLKPQYDGLNAKYTEDDTNFGALKQVYEKRKKEKEQDPGTGSTPIIAICSVIGLLVVGGAGVAVFIFMKRRKAKKEGAKPKDGQDPPNSGGAAPAVDSQNPTTASQKPPSDPSAAP